ncbi:UDP-N-acetyl-D-mannosamine dehydrogenase [Dietzia kunjamensis]|uniref:UDP-N-acetyl-D-mannosamine dehydrogenase n=1 Tax=Dietzia kunjamensis TaxID=322509 RepID=UPI0033689F76
MNSFDNGIAVVGLGYIGLPTSAAIATQGVLVKGVDVSKATVDAINRGEVLIVEPDLDVAVAGAFSRGKLVASTEMPEADAFLIAVPTPFVDGNLPDLSNVQAAAEAIAPRLRGGEVVILESTSPPGTTRKVSEWIGAIRPDLQMPHEAPYPDVHIAHCPERVLPGRIMIELITNDRIIGGLTVECGRRAAEVYELFCQGEILFTDAESAEMAKLVENSFRDVNIAFANELSEISKHLGLDVWEIIRLANRHPRVNVLNPGPGVGGHCIAVDPWFIVAAAPEKAKLIRSAREINDARPFTVSREIQAEASKDDLPIACLGLAFKANIDDLRESPALSVTRQVAEALPSRRILAVEPHVSELPPALSSFSNIDLVSLQEALDCAGTIALLVDHSQFAEIDQGYLAAKRVIDTRGMWADGRSHLEQPSGQVPGPNVSSPPRQG